MSIIITIAGILAVLLIAALLIGKEMNIERSIVISKPPTEVFNYVKYLKNHDNFSVWAMMDPEMKKEYRGTDGTVNFVFAWDSSKKKNVGAGEQEIKQITEGKSIEHEIRFIRPMQDTTKAKFQFEPLSGNRTKVQWGFYSSMKFPMNILKPVIANMLGKNLETGLHNLRAVMEA